MYSERLVGQIELGLRLAESGAPIPAEIREELTHNLDKEIRAATHLRVAGVALDFMYPGSREAYAIEHGVVEPGTIDAEIALDVARRDCASQAIGQLAIEQQVAD